MIELTTIYLDPERWLRGKPEESRLWDSKAQQGCCVGLGLIQLGVKKDEIDSYFTVLGAEESIEIPAPFQWMKTPGAEEVYEANDDHRFQEDATRIKRINDITVPHGLMFVLQETP